MSASRDDFSIAFRSALLQKGARTKFSLFFLICFSVLIFFLDSYPNKFMDGTRSLLNDLIYRVSSAATSPLRFISYLGNNTKIHFNTYNENIFLKKELEKYKLENLNNKFLKIEVKKLKDSIYLDESNYENNKSIIAKVFLDKDSPFLKSQVLNKGSKSQIKKGMPVVKENYLIGRIIESNYLSSRVLLLNDLNSRIPVILEPSGVQAILVGTGEKNPNLIYLPESFIPENGITIFTSGKDTIFPAGIAVGTTIIKNEDINVKLFVDPNQVSFVSIIKETNNLFKD
jgi:rod shape-determining protein MreC